ncbi:MAG: AzlD family protein [bacterium]
MIEQPTEALTIVIMAVVVYLTRAGGYLLGLQVRHIGKLRPVLEILPGCAFMAILVPAVRQGSLFDALALAGVVGIMWKTDNVALASVAGLSVLIFGAELLA